MLSVWDPRYVTDMQAPEAFMAITFTLAASVKWCKATFYRYRQIRNAASGFVTEHTKNY